MSNKSEFTSVYINEPEPVLSRNSSEPLNSQNKSNYTDPSIQTSSTITTNDTPDEPKTKRSIKEYLVSAWEHSRQLLITLFIDIGLPLAIYYILKIWLSVLIALILSGIPPLLHVIYTFWKHRRLDILGCIFVVSYIVSAVLSVVTGDVRLTLLRDSGTTAIVSVMFFLTLIPINTRWFKNRPMVFLISQQMYAAAEDIVWVDQFGEKMQMRSMEFFWTYYKPYRVSCYVITSLWSAFLMGEFISKVIMIKSTLTVDQIILYGNIITGSVVAGMTVFTIFNTRRLSKGMRAFMPEWRKQNDFTDKFPQ